MSRDLDLLVPEFRASFDVALEACRALGIEMRPFNTRRSPWTQARYWRQSRSIDTIEAAIRDLRQKGAPFLAHMLDAVGPQFGRPVTKALPGSSWHQWDEAVDCFWFLDGDASWSTRQKVFIGDGREINGYRLYGEEAVKQGLTSGGFWTDFRDWPHVQMRPGSVLDYRAWPEIDQEMQQRFPVDDG